MTATAHREAGFTLVELLVSLALLALMVSYAVSAISTLRHLNRVSGETAAQDEVDAVQRYLRQDIGDLRVVFETGESGNQTLMFDGKPQALTFIGNSDGTRETGGLNQVRMSLSETGELNAERQLLQSQVVGPINRVVLLRDVTSLQFSYAGRAKNNDEIVWQENWPKGNVLPIALRIAVEFESRGSRHWPEILVVVRAAR